MTRTKRIGLISILIILYVLGCRTPDVRVEPQLQPAQEVMVSATEAEVEAPQITTHGSGDNWTTRLERVAIAVLVGLWIVWDRRRFHGRNNVRI